LGRPYGGRIRPLAGNYPDVIKPTEFTLADRWIIARCDTMVREATAAYEKYRLNDAASAVYHFLWSELADWYIEQIKPRLQGSQPGGDVARAVVARTLEVALQLLHPIMPFITETLWRRWPGRDAEASISVSAWPRPDRRAPAAAAEKFFGLVQEVIVAVRQIRAEYNIEPGRLVRAQVAPASDATGHAYVAEAGTICRLARIGELSLGGDSDAEGIGAHAVLSDGTSIFVPLGDVLDLPRERARLDTELERLFKLVQSQESKLANQQFVSRAPAEIVAKEKEKLVSWREQHAALVDKRKRLGVDGRTGGRADRRTGGQADGK
jgi:valyl-tRNA synthetase